MSASNSDNESGSDSGSSRNVSRSRSGTPQGSGAESNVSRKSRSGSDRSRSNTPKSGRSSRSRSHSGSRSSAASGSPHSRLSCSVHSKNSTPRSRSQSPSVSPYNRRSVSQRSRATRSLTPKENVESRSQSPNLQIDDERAYSRSRSRSSSRISRSKSRSDSKARSRTRSLSGTPQSKRSSSHSTVSGSDFGGGKRDSKRKAVSSSESDAGSYKSGVGADSLFKTKKARLIDSDSDNDSEKPQIAAEDIFGDADDITDDEEKKSDTGSHSSQRSHSRSRSRSGTKSPERSRSRSRSSARDVPAAVTGTRQAADGPEPLPETRIDVVIPRIIANLGKEFHFIKLPNFLSVETHPFDPETYEDEIDEEEIMDEEGRQRIKLKVSNTIRFREYMNNKGDMVRESNARMVRWSDGSMSMHLGTEIFDVYKQPVLGDHNHLFIRQGTGLQGQSVFRTKLTFRPHSTESFTHKKMTMSLADRSQKTSGIKILTQVGKDPTTDRQYQLKKEEEKLRQAMRNQHKPQPKKKKIGAGEALSGAGSSYHQDDVSDDENAISLSAIKNRYKKGGGAQARGDQKASTIYSSDDDDGSDFEGRRNKKGDKIKAVKALRDSDSDDSEVERSSAKGEGGGSGSDGNTKGSNKSGSGTSSGSGSGSGSDNDA